MARIIYFYREMAEFIRTDIDLLREHHEVTVVACPSRWPRPLFLMRLIARADLVLAWFASWHSFVPSVLCRLLRKPCIVTVGGYDTANLPEIGYGHQRGGLKRIVSLATMRLATRVIVVSEASRREVLGIGLPATQLSLAYHGLDPDNYPPSHQPREDLVVTVGGVNQSNLTRKGLEVFVRTAALCPDAQFVVIGAWTDDAIGRLKAVAGANVHFTGWITHPEKVEWLSRARVMLQPSLHEAFGVSVAEGMLCGAIAVVTRNGSLPEVVGEYGIVVESQDPTALADGVRRALAFGPKAGARGRAWIAQHFALDRRRQALQSIVASELETSPLDVP